MLQLDDVQLYDLSEAGALLFSDPARLRRLARLRQVPAARVEADMGLPAPWVEAECGRSGADPESLRSYWLERLAPPAPDARRPRRARDRLPAETLLTAEEAATRIHATAPALLRLTQDGTLPALRVDGERRYDEVLVALVAGEDESEPGASDRRRAQVRAWARYEYETAPPATEPPTTTPAASERPAAPSFAFPAQEQTETAPAPEAWTIPDDLGVAAIEPLAGDGAEPPDPPASKPSTLIDVDGFETIDED